jgi:hypothetical protein
VITALAEMVVPDHVLESITGHLSRRILEHYSHIRIDAKRQALDGLDDARARHDAASSSDAGRLTEAVTAQSTAQSDFGSVPDRAKLLIPLKRRDVRVVEGARLESVCRRNPTVGSNPTLSASF